MQLTISSSALLNKLQTVSRVVSAKPGMPILQNVLFEVKGETMTITASDIETTLVTTLEVQNPDASEIVIAASANLMVNTLKEIPEQPILLIINEENLSVEIRTSNAEGKYNFVGMRGDEFPTRPELKAETAHHFSMTSSQLLTGVTRTLFASSNEELRPTMTGIFFDLDGNNLTLAATDAHKMARLTYDNIANEGQTSFILPKKPSTLLKNVCKDNDEEVKIDFDDKNIFFTMNGYFVVCRQIEGRFPNYRSVIPQNNPYRVYVNRLALASAIKRVSVYATQSTGLLKFEIKDNNIRLTAQDIEYSTAALENVPCNFEGASISIGFKAALLIEILSYLQGDEVVIVLADQARAGVLVPAANLEHEDLLMLLMPMVTND